MPMISTKQVTCLIPEYLEKILDVSFSTLSFTLLNCKSAYRNFTRNVLMRGQRQIDIEILSMRLFVITNFSVTTKNYKCTKT